MGIVGRTLSQIVYRGQVRPGLYGANLRPPTSRDKLKYFATGLGRMAASLLSSKTQPPGGLQALPAGANVDSTTAAGTSRLAAAGRFLTLRDKALVSGPAKMIMTSDADGASPAEGTIIREVRNAVVRFSHGAFAVEEIAESSGYGVETTLYALRALEKDGRIKEMSGFYHKIKLDDDEAGAEVNGALARRNVRASKFFETGAGKRHSIGELQPQTASIHDLLDIAVKQKEQMGVRHLDILLCDSEADLLYLEHRDRFPADHYRPAGAPAALMKAALDGSKLSYIVRPGIDASEAARNLAAVGLTYTADMEPLFASLREQKIEYLIISKAMAADRTTTQAVMVISNPLFFGPNQDGPVMNELNLLVRDIGRKLEKIRQAQGASVGMPAADSGGQPAVVPTVSLDSAQSFAKVLDILSAARKKDGVRRSKMAIRGEKGEVADITIDEPAKLFRGNNLDVLVDTLYAMHDGFSKELLKKALQRADKLKLKIDERQAGPKGAGFNIVTKLRNDMRYLELIGIPRAYQKSGFTVKDVHAVIKEAFIEEAAEKMMPGFKNMPGLRFTYAFLRLFLYFKLGWEWLKPKVFDEVKVRGGFLADTSVPLGALLSRVDSVHPNPLKADAVFDPGIDVVSSMLHDGYRPHRVTVDVEGVGEVAAYVVKGHFSRQEGTPPAYRDARVEQLVRDATDPAKNDLPEGDYDVAVFFEVGLSDLRRYFQAGKKKNIVSSATGAISLVL
ncbi:MAG: hypothetical protein HQ596_02900 [Candidatus Saganbacteria bacterium]|nr:hypothetical protein [Candidatus Saganbacteria bacterium]